MARAKPPPPPAVDPLHRDILAVSLATLGALVLASLLLGAHTPAYFVHYVSSGLLLALGYGAYLVAACFLALALYFWQEKTHLADTRVLIGISLLFLVTIAAMHLPRVTMADPFAAETVRTGGGYVGAGLAWALHRVLGMVGTIIVLGGAVAIAVLLVTQGAAKGALGGLGPTLRELWAGLGRLPDETPRRDRRRPSLRPEAERATRRSRRQGEAEPALDGEPRVDLSEDNGKPARARKPRAAAKTSPDPTSEPNPVFPVPLLTEEEQPALPLSPVPSTTSRRKHRDPGSFHLPSLDLLTRFDENLNRKEMEEETAERIITLEDTLESFGISAKVTHYERGPVLTRYEVEPERGIRVNQITRLADDLAMSLAAVDVRVEAPIPGKSAIGIEVPNEKRSPVGLRGVMESEEFRRAPREILPLALGRDIAGQPIVADLVSMPHLLIAGATGSGKSVCLHSIVLSLVMTHTPEEVRLIIIDPKRVEMAVYDGIPHLTAPVVHSVQQASSIMRKGIREMEKRYDKFALKGVTNLSEYNELARLPKESIVEEFGPLPRVVIIIDELADLMMQARAEFEYSICRLAQLARATGIHLVVATQRPSVKIITGNIKANMPSRISLAVASIHDSRTILDGQGAERLIGQGDMLYAPLDAPKPRRIQGSFVPREDIARLADYLRDQGEPEFDIVPDEPEEGEDYAEDMDASDELYAAAVEYVVSEQMASVSMLQRRFKVGYARAGRLIDLMEQRGVIGVHEGSKPRRVLLPPGGAGAYLQSMSGAPTGWQAAEDRWDEDGSDEDRSDRDLPPSPE